MSSFLAMFRRAQRSVGLLLLGLLPVLSGAQVFNDTYKPNLWDGGVKAMALQPDGMLVIGGTFQHADTRIARNRIARLNEDGWVDPTFDPDANGEVLALAVQTDGKILVGGSFTTVGGQARSYLARLAPDGTVDPSFIATVDGAVRALALLPDGKIWVGGSFNQVNGVACAALALLDAGGALATERDNLGAVTWTYGSPFDESHGANYGVARLLRTSANRVVVVAGETSSSASLLWRMGADGRRDTGFAAPSVDAIYALGEQSTGKLVIGGTFLSVDSDATRQRLARLNIDGTLDTSFTQPPFPSGVDAVLVLPDDRILATSPGLNSKFQCMGAEGGVEFTFEAPLSVFMSAATPTALVRQPDGKIIVNAGQQGLTRLNADGSLDTSTQALDLWVTGGGAYGKLGLGSYGGTGDQVEVLKRVAGAKAVAVGGQHLLFAKDDGTLWGAGRNDQGQLGVDPTTLAYTSDGQPRQVAGVTDVATVVAGSNHSFFIKTDGTLWAMGDNTGGKLGNRNTTDQYAPVQIATGVAAVAAGVDHSLYVTTSGDLYAMGSNTHGQLGTSSYTTTPMLVATGVKAVAAGDYFSLYLKTDGTLYGMGQNSSGQLGQGDTTNRGTPALIATGVSTMAAGAAHSAFVTTEGYLMTMGYNASGQLGYSVADTTTPQRVAGLIQAATQVACGFGYTVFLKSDGTLWGMGDLSDGALGVGRRAESNTFTPVKIAHYVRALAAKNDLTAILTRGDAALPGRRVTIQTPPQTATVAAGAAHTLSVTATGAGTLTYQWYKVGGPFGGGLLFATQPTYAIPSFSASDAGAYYVEVTNDWGTVASAQAVLTLEGPSPVQAKFDSYVPPTDGTYYTGQVLEFKVLFDQVVAVTGAPQLALTIGAQTRYADYVAGSTPTGGFGLTFRYTLTAADSDADGIAIVSPLVLNGGTIKDQQGTDALLTFTPIALSKVKVVAGAIPGPTVSSPQNAAIPVGMTATFTVSANGVGTLTYRWEFSTDDGGSWKALPAAGVPESGVDTHQLSVIAQESLDGRQYRCVVTDANSSTTSAAAKLTVQPIIAVQPVDKSIPVGTTASFRLEVQPALQAQATYEWQALPPGAEAWQVAPHATVGADGAAYLSALGAATGTKFRCVVSITGGATVTSREATLTITGQETAIISQPVAQTARVGDTVQFQIQAHAAVRSNAPTYQWYKKLAGADAAWTELRDNQPDEPYTGTQTNTLVVSARLFNSGAAYQCRVHWSTYSATSEDALLTVTSVEDNTLIAEQPADQSIPEGTTTSFTLLARSDIRDKAIYEWQIWDASNSQWLHTAHAGVMADGTPFAYAFNYPSGTKFRCYVSVVGGGTMLSREATLTRTPQASAIIGQPVDQTARVGDMVEFKVQAHAAVRSNAPTYQWYKTLPGAQYWTELRDGQSDEPYTGTQTDTLVMSARLFNSGAIYQCQVRWAEGNCAANSNIATLTVTSVEDNTIIAEQPADQSIPVGTTTYFTLKVRADLKDKAIYEWQLWDASNSQWLHTAQAGVMADGTPFVYAFNYPSGTKFRCYVSVVGGSTMLSREATLTRTPESSAIIGQPVDQTVAVGATVEFKVQVHAAVRRESPTYQWYKKLSGATDWTLLAEGRDNEPYTGVNTDTLVMSARLFNTGAQYFCQIYWGDQLYSTRSTPATLTVTPPPPEIARQPENQKAQLGGDVTFSVGLTDPTGYTFQWQYSDDHGATWRLLGSSPFRGRRAARTAADIAGLSYTGANTSELTINSVTLALYGYQFRCLVSNGVETVTSGVSMLTLPWSQFSALSARAPAGTGEQTLILGFVFAGGGKPTLVRGVGPGISTVSGYMRDPQLRLYTASGVEVASNDDWAGSSELSDAFVRTGAGALDPASKDAALFENLTGNVYTAHVSGAAGTTGVALAEAYDASLGDKTKRLTALSVRNQVGVDDAILIAGFVISGDVPKRVVVRGVGPGISTVSGYLRDPQLQVWRLNTLVTPAKWELVGENDDWDHTATTAALFKSVGMGELASDSKDAALVLTLEPGIYTAQVSGVGRTTGVGLAEIYEAP